MIINIIQTSMKRHLYLYSKKLQPKLNCKFSSLAGGNPMFPQRPIPEFEENTKNSNTTKSNDESFLARHGGKVGIISLGLAIGLIYTYFQGMWDRNALEDKITANAKIEPYEINELRDRNQLKRKDFQRIAYHIIKLNNNSSRMSYKNFILNVESFGYNIRSGHLLDRWMIQYLSSINSNDIQDWNTEVSKVLLLSLLSLTLESSSEEYPNERIGAIFHLSRAIDKYIVQENIDTIFQENDEKLVSMASVTHILDGLIETNQIPSEKLVIETGVKYPIKKWRVKTSEDMLQEYFQKTKKVESINEPSIDDNNKNMTFTFDDFHRLLISTHVCAWASCYRGNNNT